jgi:alkanesulfonate monooxygenase SsuD/methylene tetrahydromethanopterin reductase-like flavin-dependent oxidoreductase (luciferase family)
VKDTGSTVWHDASVPRERQPTTGVAIRDPWPWPVFSGITRLAEALGFDAVFLPEIAGRDAFAALAALAGETSTMRLATGVVPMPSRSLDLIAMAAATVHERSGGRAILGVGTGPPRPGALDALRRHVVELRTRLAGPSGSRAGAPTLGVPSAIPVWVAALGPRATRLAGEVADGVLLNWCPPQRVAMARAELAEGAAAAGRDPSEVEVGVYVRSSLVDDEAAAMDAVRGAVGEYASYPAYARQLRQVGLGDAAERAAAAHRAGRPGEVPDELVRAVTLVGDVGRARERLDAYRREGADVVIVYPVAAGANGAASVADTLEALAPGRLQSPA